MLLSLLSADRNQQIVTRCWHEISFTHRNWASPETRFDHAYRCHGSIRGVFIMGDSF